MHACVDIKAVAIVLLIVAAQHNTSRASSFGGEEELAHWLTYYYLQPEPERFSEVLAMMSGLGMLDEAAAQPLIAGFMSGVFQRNPERLGVWLAQARDYPTDQYSLFLLGVWHAEMKDSQSLVMNAVDRDERLERNLGFLAGMEAPLLTEIPLDKGHWVLNLLWGRFMATGDEQPIVRIMQALPWIEHYSKPALMSIGRAAYWSLAANAARHPRVMAICEDQLPRQPAAIAVMLKKVVEQAKQPLASPLAQELPVSR